MDKSKEKKETDILTEDQIKIIAKYLSGESNREEGNKVKHWLKSNKKNKEQFNLFKKIWETPKAEPEASNIDDLWLQLSKKAGIKNLEKSEKNFFFLINNKKILKYAALFFLILFIPFLWNYLSNQTKLSLKTINVAYGKQKKIILNDGSIVNLDSGSLFKYPQKFKTKKREVFLEGEGYFKIKKDIKRPFYIIANHARIEVLGTEFNVSAWKNTKEVAVFVKKGKVSFGLIKSPKVNEVIVSSNEVSSVSESGKPSKPKKAEKENYLNWVNRKRVYKNNQFGEILDQIKRWYNIKFKIEKGINLNEKLSVIIDNKPIDEILEMLTTLMDINYNRVNNTVFLNKKK